MEKFVVGIVTIMGVAIMAFLGAILAAIVLTITWDAFMSVLPVAKSIFAETKPGFFQLVGFTWFIGIIGELLFNKSSISKGD